MRIISSNEITQAVAALCKPANTVLPAAMKEALRTAVMRETEDLPSSLMSRLIENAELAERESLPICQDTGYACVFLDIGFEVHIEGDINKAVDEGIARGYTENYLRASIVSDPLRRVNTDDNTPAVLYVRFVPGDRIKITAAPKGCGSENKSAIKMLNPSDGREGVISFVIDTVKNAGGSACPPMVLGIGIGGTFDTCAQGAKRALLRDAGTPNADPYYAELEDEILRRVNGLNIGPAGFGGVTTALSAAIIALPTHIAGLPAAVNICCHAARHASVIL